MINSEFKQLLKEGIDSVANRQSKKVRAVEEAIGEALHVSHHTVQRWKRGYVPNEFDRIEFLLSYCQRLGRVDRAWGQRLLTQAGHPAPDTILDRVFPKTEGKRDMPRIYHNLPPRYGQFVGREAELERVLEWIENSRWPLASIEGMGGIGKTSLALEVAHRCLPNEPQIIARPFTAVVWTSARDQADFDLGLDQVLDAIARVLDYTYLTQLQVEQKARAVDKLLRSQRVLVVVDNFETITDLALVKFLERVPEPSLALITSRYKQLRRVWDIPLYGLKNDEMLTLVRRHSYRIGLNVVAGADDETLLRLAVATGNNPKAVELALGLIKHKGLPFNTVVDELYQASEVVEEVFDYIFAEAWKLLDDRTRKVLLTMPFFVTTASRTALSTISGVSGFEFHKAIEQLVGMSLLEATEALDVDQQRYQMHSLTQAFARNELNVDVSLTSLSQNGNGNAATVSQIKVDFYTFFVEWSRKKGCCGFWDYVSWGAEKYEEIYLELPNLLLALEWAYQDQRWAEVLALARVIVHPVYYQGHLNLRIKCSEYGLTASRQLALVADEIWFIIQGLGSVYLVRGDYVNTEKYLRRGLELAREQHLSDGIALGETYLAYLTLQSDQLTQAQEHVKLALSYAEAPFFKYRAHHAAGHVARYLKDYEKAREYYLRSAEFLSGPGYLDTSDVWLGFTKLGQKEYKKAEDYFRHYLDTYGKYGNQRVVGMANLGLALYYEVQGHLPESRNFASEAFNLLSQMNAQWELKQVKELLERLEKTTVPTS